MADEDISWKGEPTKIVINFSDTLKYEVYSSTEVTCNKFIKKVEYRNTEGNTESNIMGATRASSADIYIYDPDDSLSPTNTKSPYYGLMYNGIEIKIYKAFDGTTWENYGTYYATGWYGGFSDGGYNEVRISGCMRVECLGTREIPKLKVYTGLKIIDLIDKVFTGLGLTKSVDWDVKDINNLQNLDMLYGVSTGDKVIDFLNNVCQLMLARVITDRDNKIWFVPALKTYGTSWTIPGDITGPIDNNTTDSVNYYKLRVQWMKKGSIVKGTVLSDSAYNFDCGNGTINDINFSSKVLSVYSLKVEHEYDDVSDKFSKLHFNSWQDSMQLDYTLNGNPISDAYISVDGQIVNTSDKYAETTLSTGSPINGSTLTFDTKMIFNDDIIPNQIAANLKTYVEALSKNKHFTLDMSDRIFLGDEVTLVTGISTYDGVEKVVEVNITEGDGEHSIELTTIKAV